MNSSNPSEASKADISFRLMCPDCKDPNPDIIEDFSQGDLICGRCGIILGDRIVDTRSEWRTFSSESGDHDPSRVGAPTNPLLEGTGLDTMISKVEGGSGTGNDLSRWQSRGTVRGLHVLVSSIN